MGSTISGLVRSSGHECIEPGGESVFVPALGVEAAVRQVQLVAQSGCS